MAQTILEIEPTQLLDKVSQFNTDGYRLAQICCTKVPERLELSYSFDKDYEFVTLRINLVNADTVIPSVSGIYCHGFLYENEIHDLFGIKVDGIAIDYKGKFYHTAVVTPFNLEEKK